MMQNSHIPISAAALTILLAACGGGGDSGDKTVSSSPDVSSAASVVVDTSTTAGAGSESDTDASAVTNSSSGAMSTGTPTNAASNSATTGSVAGSVTSSDSSSNTGNTASSNTSSDSRGSSNNGSGTYSAGTTLPDDSATSDTDNTQQPATSSPVQPFSAQGIRGDVFLAMLEQKPCNVIWFTPVPGPDGSFHSEGRTNALGGTDFGNYVRDENYVGPPSPVGCVSLIYKPAEVGWHTFSLGNNYYSRFSGPPPEDFRRVDLELPVGVTNQDLTIAQYITVHAGLNYTFRFHREGVPFVIGYDALMPFGTTLQWNEVSPIDPANPQYVRFFIHKGDNDREVRMCFNTHTASVKQLQCITWAIPDNWQTGEMLKDTAQTLVNDLSVIPGRSGFAYWN